MNFLALLLGLAIERSLTHLFHLREFRWLDPLFDAAFRRAARRSRLPATLLLAAVVALLAAPVAALSWALWDELLHVPYFAFAVLVLLFALGPRDLGNEVEEYLAALPAGDPETLRRLAKELAEQDPPAAPAARNETVERAIYLQANNRVFAVVFWFLVAGPTGAWAFRVLDAMRRRMAYRRLTDADPALAAGLWSLTRELHALAAWVPCRLLAAGYVLAGDFETAFESWRRGGSTAGLSIADASDAILARVGSGAAGRSELDPGIEESASERVRAARSLVIRTLWIIWCPVIALLTMYNWVA
jgi:membrane protein required for beta-lactamase induction